MDFFFGFSIHFFQHWIECSPLFNSMLYANKLAFLFVLMENMGMSYINLPQLPFFNKKTTFTEPQIFPEDFLFKQMNPML